MEVSVVFFYFTVVLGILTAVLLAFGVFLYKNFSQVRKTLEGERLYRNTLIESLPAGIIEYDHEYRILSVNRKLELITGLARSSIENRQIKPEDRANPELTMLAVMIFGAEGNEIAFPDKTTKREFSFSGSRELIVLATYVPINAIWMKKRLALLIVEDVTREKLIGQMKTEFISIAAHQLRTPLSIIKWTIRMLLDEDIGPLNEKQKEFLRRGFETNERMITLVSDLLNVNRIEEGRFGYEFTKGDLIQFMKQTVDGRSFVFQERNINLSVNFQNAREEAYFDQEKLSLAITNILDNAIKYTPPGGNINIECDKFAGKLQITIKDSGVGIPERQKERLFSKFFRGTNVIRMQTEGSGLGLFIAKNIIVAHGGTIRVESEEGLGTTVFITLPLGIMPSIQPDSSSTGIAT